MRLRLSTFGSECLWEVLNDPLGAFFAHLSGVSLSFEKMVAELAWHTISASERTCLLRVVFLSFLIVSVGGVFWERACTLPVMLCAGEGSFQSVSFGAQPEKTYLHIGTLA